MLKSTKQFILSSEVKNKKGFRVKTAGIDIGQFALNPIMLFMHTRPKGENKQEVLPLGYWDDLTFKDGKLYGTPVFDDTDPFAVSIYNKVENGTIRMASAGLEPGEWYDDGVDIWLMTSTMVESSIVDRGSNTDAMSAKVALYDGENNMITLSDKNYPEYIKTQLNTKNMKLIQLNEQSVKLLLLADGATEADAQAAIQNLITLADQRKTEISTLSGKVTDLTKAAKDAELKLNDEKIETLLEKAISDRKILREDKESLIALADGKFDPLKNHLDKLKPAPAVKEVIELKDNANNETATWDQLDKRGELVKLKDSDFPKFKDLYKAKFKREYQDS